MDVGVALVDAGDVALELVEDVDVAVPVEEVEYEEGGGEELSRAGVHAVEDDVRPPVDFHVADRLAPALVRGRTLIKVGFFFLTFHEIRCRMKPTKKSYAI